MSPRIALLDRLFKRGLINAIYPESGEYRDKLTQHISNGPISLYSGFDATSSSLHIGNLATIISSLHFYNEGHQVICVVGDATAQIGDPSGHTRDRKQIDRSVISENAAAIEKSIRNLFNNYHCNFISSQSTTESKRIKPPIIIRNSAWYSNTNLVDFVGEFFRDVRVAGLLHKKSIQERLQTKEGMNMAEFSYQIFQAFDWLELRKRYDCRVQIGGNDQQGNIYSGHDLIKKRLGKSDSFGVLVPLITNAKGKKLGKTAEGMKTGIWLDADLTSPYDFYQFFHRTPDTDVEKFLKIFSFFDDSHLEELIEARLKDKSDIWCCQRKLAEQACLLVHGRDGLEEAKRRTEALFPTNKNRSSL